MSKDNKHFILTILMIILAISTTLYLSFRYHDKHENKVIFQNTELLRFQKDILRFDIRLTRNETMSKQLKYAEIMILQEKMRVAQVKRFIEEVQAIESVIKDYQKKGKRKAKK